MKCKQILVLIFACFGSLLINAQDLIYKKNGEILAAKIVNTLAKSITYQLPGETGRIIHHLTIEAVDSILYQNGKKDAFFHKRTEYQSPAPKLSSTYHHHLIGLDLAGLAFYRNLTFSYEYLPGKTKIGFRLAYARSIKLMDPYDYYYRFNFGSFPEWTFRAGMNGYIFPQRTFRFGSGVYYVFGSYPILEYRFDQSSSSYWEITGNKNLSGLVFCAFGFYNITKNLAANLSWDIPVAMTPESRSILRCELLLNF